MRNNLTTYLGILVGNIDLIAKSFNIKPVALLDEETAKLAKKLPPRVDMYKKSKNI